MDRITPSTKVLELIEQYPFLKAFLIAYAPHFKQLDNPLVRHTVGRVATLKMASSMGSVPLGQLMHALADEVRKHTGRSLEVTGIEDSAQEDLARKQVLKQIIRDLHAGQDLEALQKRFVEQFEHVGATEIARMENELIQEGMPAHEVRRLCDVHVAVFRPGLDMQLQRDAEPGHPANTYRAENSALEEVCRELQATLEHLGPEPATDSFNSKRRALNELLARLGQVEKHYVRKENQLFPLLEKHGIVGPPQVMWSVHDTIRGQLKTARQQLEEGVPASTVAAIGAAATGVADMIYKENNILLPMCLEVLQENDWIQVRQGEEEVGYALIQPPGPWHPRSTAPEQESTGSGLMPRLALDTGLLTLDQVNLLLNHLPVEVSFVDEHDEVRYFSGGEGRLFPRSPAVIGRKVQNCHPPKSVHMVNRILDEFREGSKDDAEFWIQMRGKFLHIRYFAMRDANHVYRGCLEVTQDVTGIRTLEGERRLLDW